MVVSQSNQNEKDRLSVSVAVCVERQASIQLE